MPKHVALVYRMLPVLEETLQLFSQQSTYKPTEDVHTPTLQQRAHQVACTLPNARCSCNQRHASFPRRFCIDNKINVHGV